ncbi:MAG: dTDP-4-dehydrorhamnose 3,5-epimerase [Patescibacteria group bacterium]
MEFKNTPLSGVLIIQPDIFGDERGYFYETYHKVKFVEHGITEEFIQDNQSFSEKGIVRGLHFQKPPTSQSKLVRVISGEVYDVAVDLRPTSPTFGNWFGIYLSGENKTMLYVPVGFAHGFCVTSETAIFCYKCGELYSKDDESGIRFDDPDLNIDWPVKPEDVKLSDKDAVLKTFAEIKGELAW